MIPLVDVRAQNASLRGEIDAAIGAVIDDASFVLGPAVARFERAFAAYIGVEHCVAVSSGTAALHLALLGLGIGPGDEVLTAPSSFFATAEAVSLSGARPTFADVEAETLNLDPERIEDAVTPRTRMVLPVHLYGQTAELAPIGELVSRHGLLLVEDACQAHGATYAGRRAGSIGRAGCFSFYPGKNLGALGEGGAVTTDDATLAARIRLLRDHGSRERYHHEAVGFNYRMDGLQGAVLAVKLPHLDAWNAARRVRALRYCDRLAGVGDLRLPVERGPGRHAWHLFVARSSRRERIFERFAARGIARAIHYPTPIHLQEAYRELGLGPGSFPVAEAAAREIFSLPLYPELTESDQDAVVATIREAF